MTDIQAQKLFDSIASLTSSLEVLRQSVERLRISFDDFSVMQQQDEGDDEPEALELPASEPQEALKDLTALKGFTL